MQSVHRINAIEQKLSRYALATECAYKMTPLVKKMRAKNIENIFAESRVATAIYFNRLHDPKNPAYELTSAQLIRNTPPELLVAIFKRHTRDLPVETITPLLSDSTLSRQQRSLVYIARKCIISEQRYIAAHGPLITFFHADTFGFTYEKAYGKLATHLIRNRSLAQAVQHDDYSTFRILLATQGYTILPIGFIEYLIDQAAYDIVLGMAFDHFVTTPLANARILSHCITNHPNTDSQFLNVITAIDNLSPGIIRKTRDNSDDNLMWNLCDKTLQHHRFYDELYDHLFRLGCDPFYTNRLGLSPDDYKYGLINWLNSSTND